LWGQPPAGQSHSYDCDLSEIEIGIVIEIEKVWDLDFDPDFDFDKAIFTQSPCRMHFPFLTFGYPIRYFGRLMRRAIRG
jgi:hypothetical protein